MAGSEYKKTENGGVTTFDVTPAPAPKFWFLIIIGGLCCLGIFALPGGFFFVAMGAFALWYGWTRDLRPLPTRVPSTFKVTPDAIEANGRTFKKDDIHRILLKNSITDKELPGLSTYTTNTNVAAGMAFRAQASMTANTLNVEQGGKSTVLAGGMDDTTAYGLLADVCKIVGFKVS